MSLVDSELCEAAPRAGRGRPRGPSGKNCRNARITFRCTRQEKLVLESLARDSRVSLGDWLREHLLH